MPTPSQSLSENLIGVIEAFGAPRPTSFGLTELYQALIAAIEGFSGEGTGTFTPEEFGALGDGFYLTDASVTAGVTQLTSPSAPFAPSVTGATVVLQPPVAQVSQINGTTASFSPHPQTVTAVAITGGGTASVPELTMTATGSYSVGQSVFVKGTGTELDNDIAGGTTGGYHVIPSGGIIDGTHLTVVASRTDSASGSGASNVIGDVSCVVSDYGKPVASGGNIPSGAFVGAVTPATSFLLVDTNGNALNPSGTVTTVTIGTAVSAAASGTFTNAIQVAMTSITAVGPTGIPAQITVGDLLSISHAVYGGTGLRATGPATATYAPTGVTTVVNVVMNTGGRTWTVSGTTLTNLGTTGGVPVWAPLVTTATYLSATVITLGAAPTYTGTGQPALVAHDDQLAFNNMLIAAAAVPYPVISMRPGAVYGISQVITTPAQIGLQQNGFILWQWHNASLVALRSGMTMLKQTMAGFHDGPRFDLSLLAQKSLWFNTGLLNQGSQANCASMTAGDATNTVTFSPSIPFASTNAHLGGTSGFGVGSPVVVGGGETIQGAGRLRPNGLGAGLRSFVATLTTDGGGNVTSATLQDTALTSCTTTRFVWGDVNSVPIGVPYFGARRMSMVGWPPGSPGFAMQCNDSSIGYPFIIQRLDMDACQASFNYSAINEPYNLASVVNMNFRAGWGHDDYSRGLVNLYAFDHAHVESMIDLTQTEATDSIVFDQQLGGLGIISGKVSIRDPYGTGLKIINNASRSNVVYMVDSRDVQGNVQWGTPLHLHFNANGDTTADHTVSGELPSGISIDGAASMVRLMGPYVGPCAGNAKHWAPVRVNFSGHVNLVSHGTTFELSGGNVPNAGTATLLSMNNNASATVDIQGGQVLNGGALMSGATTSIQAPANNSGIPGGLAYCGTGVVVNGQVQNVLGLSSTVNRSITGTVLPSEYSVCSATITLTLPANQPAGSAPNYFEVSAGHTVTLATTDGSSLTLSSLVGAGRWTAVFDSVNNAWRVNAG